MKAKLNNGKLEYFQQPTWLLGDATAYATEQGYKEVTYSEYPVLEANQYVIAIYTETETEIVVNYSVLVNENYTAPEPPLEDKITELQQVITELIITLNDKGILP